MSGGANPFFNPDWLEIQRQYLGSLGAGPSATGGGDPSSAWQQAVAQWWQTVLGQVPAEAQSLFNHIFHQSLSFSSMTGQFARLIDAMANGGDDWQSVLHQQISRMQEQFHPAGAAEAAAEPWRSAFDAWHPALPDELFRDLGGEALRELVERFQALPAAGPAGGYLAMLQETLHLWQDYQERCTQYHNVFRRLGRDALARLERRILQLARDGGRIGSLRELYNLWVECSEEVFSEYAGTEEYAMLYGELLMDFMAFRRKSRELLDATLRQLDLPTRESLAAVRKDQHALRRQLHETLAQQQRTRAELEALQAELEELRRGKGGKKKAKTPGAAARDRPRGGSRGKTGRGPRSGSR